MARTVGPDRSERKRTVTAQQIEELRKVAGPLRSGSPSTAGHNELIQYVMAHVRQSPVKLIDLKPTKTRGPRPLRRHRPEAPVRGDLRGPRCLPGLGRDRPSPAPGRLAQGRASTKDRHRAQCPARPAEPGGEGEEHRAPRSQRAGGEDGSSAMNTAQAAEAGADPDHGRRHGLRGVLDRPAGAARP